MLTVGVDVKKAAATVVSRGTLSHLLVLRPSAWFLGKCERFCRSWRQLVRRQRSIRNVNFRIKLAWVTWSAQDGEAGSAKERAVMEM
jgi:hypothetical protein